MMSIADIQIWLHFEWGVLYLALDNAFRECWLKLQLRVRCMSIHSKECIPWSTLRIALKWCELRLIAVWWKLLTMQLGSTLIMRDKAHSQLIILSYVNVLRFKVRCIVAHSEKRWWWCTKKVQWSEVCCNLIPNDILTYGVWCVAWMASGEVLSIIFHLYKYYKVAFKSLG